MANPYASGPGVKVLRSQPDVPATSEDGLRGGIRVAGRQLLSSGPAFGSNGELNASSKKELMQVVANVLQQSREGNVMERHASPEVMQERLAQVREAYYDRSNTKLEVLGEVLSEEILTPRILVQQWA
tara:strand:- start:112962 stop:113345 length:384 start_codon:yes stop_codon:yes gene_type:complete